MQRIPILAYHRIVDDLPQNDYYEICLRRELFEAQMRTLAADGYTTLPLETASRLMRGRAPIPPKSFVLAFDDGYLDTFEVAVPTLRELGFTATVFVVAGLVGQRSMWDAGKCCTAPLMDWAHLEQLLRWGFSIGSHTLTHPELRFLQPDDARFEIERSRYVLEDCLGVPITTFCYPFGEWNETSYRIVRAAGYLAACNDTWRKEHRPFALARIDPRYRLHPLREPVPSHRAQPMVQ
jgi:peptidoglycan/xylan/chitin deacetylase (PgdA/CDA1 family)